MAEDSGIDRQRILDEIVGEAPLSPPLEPAAPPPPPLLRANSPSPAVVPAPAPLLPARSPAWLVRHRVRIAALVMVFAGLLWLAVAIAAGRGMAGLVGTAFVAIGAAAAAWEWYTADAADG